MKLHKPNIRIELFLIGIAFGILVPLAWEVNRVNTILALGIFTVGLTIFFWKEE